MPDEQDEGEGRDSQEEQPGPDDGRPREVPFGGRLEPDKLPKTLIEPLEGIEAESDPWDFLDLL